jgi:cyclophilin family peptidyl-prolyl cis-trans isomerase
VRRGTTRARLAGLVPLGTSSASERPGADFGFLLLAVAVLASAACGRRSPPAIELDLEPPAPERVLAGFDTPASIPVQLVTEEGVVRCTLDAERAPRAAASFVGLATGRSLHRNPRDGALSNEPLYEHLHFFRAVPGIFVQTGCPLDNGTGHPGYRYPPEPHPDDAARLGRGALFLASYTAPPGRIDPHPPPPGHTLGSQFAIALTSMKHLAGKTTVLGRCEDLDVVERLARAREAGRLPALERVLVTGGPPR